MGLWESVKNIMSIPEEDEFDEEPEQEVEEKAKKPEPQESAFRKSESAPRVFQGGKKTVSYANAQPGTAMQVVLARPERFEDASAIADHLKEKKSVVLNLEAADRDVSRRIVDFLSGAAYYSNGNIRKVANSTFIIVPAGVDVMGDLMLDDFDQSKLYF